MNITHGLRRALQINPNGLADRLLAIGARTGARSATAWRGLPAASAPSGAASGRPRRDPVAQFRSLPRALSRGRLVRRRDRAAQHPLELRWRTKTPCATAAPASCSSTRRLRLSAAALAQRDPGLKLVYADDGETPAGMENYEALIAPQRSRSRTRCARRDDLAGIFYTGGTTGRSKGVMLSHGNLMANALNALGEGLWPSSTVYLHAAPMFHLANGAAMYSVLLSGGSNVIIPGFTPDGVACGDAAATASPTCCWCRP